MESCMLKIDWNKFKVKNEDYRKAFQYLSYQLFCRQYNRGEGIFEYKNQTGIETEPINVEGEWIGFQSKFFDNQISSKKIIDSLRKAKNKNPDLNKVICYLNQSFSESSKSGKKKSKEEESIEKTALEINIKVEYFLPSHFEIFLNHPLNLDLAQLYFGMPDEFGFVHESLNSRIFNIVQSTQYIELPFFGFKNFEALFKDLQNSTSKVFTLIGDPGSGKTTIIYKFFQKFAGSDKNTIDDMRKVWTKNQAIPMMINLKECSLENISSLINKRKSDYKLDQSRLGFIYILDGLDELSLGKANQVLSYLQNIEPKSEKTKIIISCRSGSPNRFEVKQYFSQSKEYQIEPLSEKDIQKYFKLKNDLNKLQELTKLKNSNPALLAEAKDILLVVLLWETIEDLNEKSTVFDLLDQKIKLLINASQYRKNLDALNLLTPKEEKIIEINHEMAFFFSKKDQFQLTEKEIQTIILNKYPRLDYQSVNLILDYIAALFFDQTLSYPRSLNSNRIFIYQHRRYQDFFFVEKIIQLYEEDPHVLRKYNLLGNADFFEELFLNYLRAKYKKESNFPGIMELHLIDVYLGKADYYGVDEAYHINNKYLLEALSYQDEKNWQILLENSSLNIEEKISFNLSKAKKTLQAFQKKSNHYLLEKSVAEIGEKINFMLEAAIKFHKRGKQEIAQKLVDQFSKLTDSQLNKIAQAMSQSGRRLDFSYSWLESSILVLQKPPLFILKKLMTDGNSEEIKYFFQICINNQLNQLPEIIEQYCFENADFFFLVINELVSSFSNLMFFIKNKELCEIIKNGISKIGEALPTGINLLFCKKILDIKLTDSEEQYTKKTLEELSIGRSKYHRAIFEISDSYIRAAYILGIGRFQKEDYQKTKFHYYDELQNYTGLFIDYIDLLNGKTSIEKIFKNHTDFLAFHNQKVSSDIQLSFDISSLWAHIFISSENSLNLRSIKNSILNKGNKINPVGQQAFLKKLQSLSPALFNNTINEGDLLPLEEELTDWSNYDSYHEYVNYCFELASLFSTLNPKKSVDYIKQGINEASIRHISRKDSIISVHLIESFEILSDKNWLSRNDIEDYSKKIFKLACRVLEITTDGKGTWFGPKEVIRVVAKQDIDLAIDFKNQLTEKRAYVHYAISEILAAKINQGDSFESIEKLISEYGVAYLDSDTQRDSCEHGFKSYLLITENDFYSDEEKYIAFQKAYEQVEILKKISPDYYLIDSDYKESTEKFILLCQKYQKPITLEIKEDSSFFSSEPNNPELGINFIEQVKKATSTSEISTLYEQIKNNRNIELSKSEQWQILLDQTFLINQNINLFIDLLRECKYPHINWLNVHSKYLYFAVGYALGNPQMKDEIKNYLFEQHAMPAGFRNLIESYAFINDKEMCLKLFKRFLRFCNFLVN
jgi:hypothetical protein